MDSQLVNNIVAAATSASAVSHLENDLNKSDYNDRSHIDAFQDEILASLNNAYGGCVWEKEYKVPGMTDKDAIDIYGTPNKRPCIIEIDAVRHDQISPKFVSRVALCGLDRPIDYVVILYPSKLKSGRLSCEKFVRFMHDILKAINKDSSLVAVYVDPITSTHEVWDYGKQ